MISRRWYTLYIGLSLTLWADGIVAARALKLAEQQQSINQSLRSTPMSSLFLSFLVFILESIPAYTVTGSPTMRRHPRIDVHSHIIPSFYREALISSGITKPDGMPTIPVRPYLQITDSPDILRALVRR